METLFTLENVITFIKIFISPTMAENITILLNITSCYKMSVLQIIKCFYGYLKSLRQLQD